MAIFPIRIIKGEQQLNIALDLDGKYPNENLVINHLTHGNIYEPDVSNFLVRVLRESDTVIDVGANIGFFSVLSSTLVGDSGKVVSFEPDQSNCDRLSSNLKLNNLENVILIQKPALNEVKQLNFYINSDNSGGSAVWNVGEYPGNTRSKANPRPVNMTSTTLDRELKKQGLRIPKLIKVDTEGAEQHVLEGARGILEGRRIPFIISELHIFGLDKMGCSEKSLRGFMEGIGYSTFLLSSKLALPKMIPPGTSLHSKSFINLLFSTPEFISEYWPIELVPPGGMP